jgi:erythromycin esterase-like protein
MQRHAPTSRRRFLLAASSAALLAACATSPETAPVNQAARANGSIQVLLAAQAVPIRRLDPADPGLMALAKRLASGRIIGLGHATLGSQEDALLNSLLVQALVERHDLRAVMLDANAAGTTELNAYISAAPTRFLAADVLRKAAIPAYLKTEVSADLLTWLRGWNAVNPDRTVRIAGIDCRASSQDAAEAFSALRKTDAATAELLAGALAPLLASDGARLSQNALVKRMNSTQRARAEAACREIEQLLRRKDQPDAAFAARRAWQGLSTVEFETSDTDASLAPEDYAGRRDRFLATNALQSAGASKAVFWGSNRQVVAGRPGGDRTGEVPTGALLRDELGADYLALTQEFGSARFLARAPGSDVTAPVSEVSRAAQPETLGAQLMAASPRTSWIDAATLPATSVVEAWRAAPIGFGWYSDEAGGEAQASDVRAAPPARLADVMIIHPELTPSRRL